MSASARDALVMLIGERAYPGTTHTGCETVADAVIAAGWVDPETHARSLDVLHEQGVLHGRDVTAAEVLREAAARFRAEMGRTWGGPRSWLTNGDRVAELVASIIEGWADARASEQDDAPAVRLEKARELVWSDRAEGWRNDAAHGRAELPYASNRYLHLIDGLRAALGRP